MKKYIDTEWLENNAKEYSLGYYEEDEWATPLSALDEAPSIAIIRCRECKYGLKTNFIKEPYLLCKKWSDIDSARTVKPDDFCSYGCRSEKPNNSKERSE